MASLYAARPSDAWRGVSTNFGTSCMAAVAAGTCGWFGRSARDHGWSRVWCARTKDMQFAVRVCRCGVALRLGDCASGFCIRLAARQAGAPGLRARGAWAGRCGLPSRLFVPCRVRRPPRGPRAASVPAPAVLGRAFLPLCAVAFCLYLGVLVYSVLRCVLTILYCDIQK
jgi:hypothetical protein